MPRTKKNETDSPLPQPDTQAEWHRATREAHASELAEDYVEVISELIDTRGEARAVDIAERLGVTHVTVIKTVERLMRDGLVTTEPYRSIFLTDTGRDLALECRKRHKLVVDFLQALGVSETTALADAEGIEHHVSDETLSAFKRYVSKKS